MTSRRTLLAAGAAASGLALGAAVAAPDALAEAVLVRVGRRSLILADCL